jgi:carbamoylphosphate synthase small subunit
MHLKLNNLNLVHQLSVKKTKQTTKQNNKKRKKRKKKVAPQTSGVKEPIAHRIHSP